MRKIKNWKLFTESVEDSVEDIKWLLVDYDYDESIYLKSESLIVYKLNKDVGDPDYFQTTERITRLSKPEGWDVTFIPKHNYVAMIFYKGNLDDCVISYLDEKFGNLETDTYGHYSTNVSEWVMDVAFSISPNKLNQCIASLEPMLYQIPAYCYGITYDSELFSSSYDKFIKLFKKWLLERYQIIADYIVLL